MRYHAKGEEPGATALELRQVRIDKATKMIAAVVPAPYKKVLATVALNIGVTEEKAREYIRILSNFGVIIIDKESPEKTVRMASA